MPLTIKLLLLIVLAAMMVDLITRSPWTKRLGRDDKISYSIIAVIMSGCVAWYIIENEKKILVSPSEVTINSPMKKDFILTIANNQDINVYNICLGVCINERSSAPLSSIKLEPVEKEKEFLPGIPVSLARVDISNGCAGIVIPNINLRSKKEFYITIEGEKINKGSKIVFEAYHWYKEPHFESIATKKDYVHESVPYNFSEVFRDRLEKAEDKGHVYAIMMRIPANPYFNEEKNKKDYWITVFTDN